MFKQTIAFVFILALISGCAALTADTSEQENDTLSIEDALVEIDSMREILENPAMTSTEFLVVVGDILTYNQAMALKDELDVLRQLALNDLEAAEAAVLNEDLDEGLRLTTNAAMYHNMITELQQELVRLSIIDLEELKKRLEELLEQKEPEV